jgi:hypothetical protein
MTQMMIYYNPLKLAVTVSAAVFATALAALVVVGAWAGAAVALPTAAILASLATVVFFFGCALDAARLHFEAQKGPVTLD